MNDKIVLTADNYDLIDGHNAYRSAIKKLTLGKPCKEENQNMQIAVQGGVFPVRVCVENENIDKDMQAFSQSLSDLGELTGERLRVLTRILEELALY